MGQESPVPLRIRHLTPLQAMALDPLEPSWRWQERLLECGLLAEVPRGTAGDAPQAWIRALQSLLRELREAEEELTGVDSGQLSFREDVPWQVWAALGAFPLLAFFMAIIPDAYGDRLKVLGAAYVLLGMVGAFGLGWMGLLLLQDKHRRRARREELLASMPELSRHLWEGTRSTLARSFVARGRDALLVCTPHGDWLRVCARRLRESWESSDSSRARALSDQLQARAVAVEQARQGHCSAPPDDWTDRDLAPDLAPFIAALDELGIERSPQERAWEALLAEAASPSPE